MAVYNVIPLLWDLEKYLCIFLEKFGGGITYLEDDILDEIIALSVLALAPFRLPA